MASPFTPVPIGPRPAPGRPIIPPGRNIVYPTPPGLTEKEKWESEEEKRRYEREKKDALEKWEREQKAARETSELEWEREQAADLSKFNREKNLTTTSTSTPVIPPDSPPDMYVVPAYQPYIPGAAPTYAAPTWDEGAIGALTQQKAAPGLRELRNQVQRATRTSSDNPQVGRMTLRDALRGYGSGISSVLGGASSAARGEYGQKYGIQADVAKTNYGGAMSQWGAENVAKSQGALANFQADLDRRKTGFETSWNKWKAGIGTKTTQRRY